MIERKLWLAVVLGVVIGLGLGYVPYSSTVTLQSRIQVPMEGAVQPQTKLETSSMGSPAMSLEFTVRALILGILLALPLFAIARRRSFR